MLKRSGITYCTLRLNYTYSLIKLTLNKKRLIETYTAIGKIFEIEKSWFLYIDRLIDQSSKHDVALKDFLYFWSIKIYSKD